MFRPLISIVASLCCLTPVFAQKTISTLYGFELIQEKETTHSQMGKPMYKETFDDGYTSEAFWVNKEKTAYLAFEYDNEDKTSIWSIQLSGLDSSIITGLPGISLGMPAAAVSRAFAPADSIIDIGTYGHRWDYNNFNVSFEINTAGRLSSIKIKKPDYDNEDNVDKIPTLSTIMQVLQDGNNQEIARLLHPEIEVYKGRKTIAYKKSEGTEIEKDGGHVFSTIRALCADFKNEGLKDTAKANLEMRLSEKLPIMAVYKMPQGHKIQEIVLKFDLGRWRIFEIRS